MSLIPFAPEAAAAVVGIVRPLSAVAREGAIDFMEFLHGAGDTCCEPADTAADAGALPFSAQSLQQRLADRIADGSLEFQGLGDAISGSETAAGASLADLRNWADQQLASLHARFSEKLAAAGVDMDGGLELSIRPADGSIAVGDGHSQRRSVEALLGDDSSLSQDVHQLFATLDLLRAADAHSAFAQEYQRDPQQALKNHRSLFQPNGSSSSQLIVDRSGIRLAS